VRWNVPTSASSDTTKEMDEMAKESTPTTKARQHGPKAGTPRTQRMTGEQRRTQLLDVAEQVFGDVGYTDTTMDLIAERAAITKPVLYSHFGSKDKLLIAVLWRATEDLIEELESLTARLDPSIGPREAVATVIRSYTSFVLGRPAPFRAYQNDGAALAQDPTSRFAIRDRFNEVLATVVMTSTAIAGDDREVLLRHMDILVVIMERLTERALYSGATPQETAELATSYVWGGLREQLGIKD